jgi:hypothetical protein
MTSVFTLPPDCSRYEGGVGIRYLESLLMGIRPAEVAAEAWRLLSRAQVMT